MTPEERQQLNELMQWKKNMSASFSIPLENDQAFRERFKNLGTVLTSSAHTVASETQAVNESGSSSYNVQKVPDAFIQTTIGTTVYYIPVFT